MQYYIEIPYGATEAEHMSLSDTFRGVPYFTRNHFVALRDNFTDDMLHLQLPDNIQAYASRAPVFRSIQLYTTQENEYPSIIGKDDEQYYPVGCTHLYLDIDTQDTLESQYTTRKLIGWLKSIGINKYNIYFSGSKGFHVVIDFSDVYGTFTLIPITVVKLLVENYISKLSGVKLDLSVYHSRSIIRLANSINIKTGFYKLQISESELYGDLGDIELLALSTRSFEPDEYKVSNYKFLQGLISLSEDLVEHNKSVKQDFISGIETTNLEPVEFIEEFIDRAKLRPGTRHEVSLTLASYYRARGYSQSAAEEALAEFMTRATGTTTPVNQRLRESKNDIKTCYNNMIRFSKSRALEVLV